jgi:hypothetical protein
MFLPEENLLIHLCHLNFNEIQKEELHLIAETVSDWEHFLSLSNDHGIIALCRDNLFKTGLKDKMPEATWKRFESGYLKSLSRNTLINSIADEISVIAAQENIKLVLLKGLALEKTIYGDKGIRQMTDIDLLVDKRDAVRLRNLLIHHEYQAAPFVSAIYEKKLFVEGKHLPEMFRKGIQIEIHIKLFDQKRNTLTEEFIEKSQQFRNNVYIPDKQLHFLYLVKHLAKHEREGSSQLRMYTDLVILLENFSSIMDKRLFSLAEETGIVKELCDKLNIIRIYFGVHSQNSEELKEYKDEDLIIKGFSDLVRNNNDIQTLEPHNPGRPLKYVEGLANKICFIAGYGFPSKTFIRYHYNAGENDRLLPFYIKWWKRIGKKLTGRTKS